MRAETRLSGRARARAGEGQHPLQGGWLPGLTIRWSELSPARGFATCGMGAQSARSAANEYVCDKARRCINIRPGGLTGGTVTGSAVQPTSRKALDNRALTRYARRVPVGWRWGCVADRIGDLRGWPGLPAAGCAEMILWPDVVREAGDAAGDGAAIAGRGDAVVERGEDVRVARDEGAEADREQDGDGQRQDAAFRYVFQNGRGTPIGRWCPVSGTSRHALSVQ
jgi:hypothetical protein